MADQGTPPLNDSNRIPQLANPPPIRRLDLDADQVAAEANRRGYRIVNPGAVLRRLFSDEGNDDTTDDEISPIVDPPDDNPPPRQNNNPPPPPPPAAHGIQA